jgi:hypothetical protein
MGIDAEGIAEGAIDASDEGPLDYERPRFEVDDEILEIPAFLRDEED